MHVAVNADSMNKFVTAVLCPSCDQISLFLERIMNVPEMSSWDSVDESTLLWPRVGSRPPAPPEVPEQYARDYDEAALILSDSPKASAALTRRCVQTILRESAGVGPGNLSAEIQEVINQGQLPSHIGQQLDAVREIGNLAAHPTKDENTGAVLEVEPGEAEWNLDVLDALFDHYFVKPAVAQSRNPHSAPLATGSGIL